MSETHWRGKRDLEHLYGKNKNDDPPNSRLFIVCSKTIVDEDDFRKAFDKYGTIEEIWILKDRNTGTPKGVTYIKFSKTSEAALAMEEMNGAVIVPNTRPLKVMIALSREQGSRRETNEDEKHLRLFCVVPKTMTDQELKENFQQFGDVEYASILRNHETKESKGLAFVKFMKVSHAAKAYEECDRSFKAVFAEPKKRPGEMDRNSSSGMNAPNFSDFMFNDSGSRSMSLPPKSGFMGKIDPYRMFPSEQYTSLRITVSATVSQEQLWKLFDIVPGLDYVHMEFRPPPNRQKFCHANAIYKSTQAAMYAIEKLDGFEYPPGMRLSVKLGSSMGNHEQMGGHNMNIMNQQPLQENFPSNSQEEAVARGLSKTDIAALAESIVRATSIIQAAGLAASGNSKMSPIPSNSGNVQRELLHPNYCTADLPAPHQMAAAGATCNARLFIVCIPSPPPLFALTDVFSRFGNLIDVYMLNGKNCGYAKYSDRESAQAAIETLDGQSVLNCRLKVMEAEPLDESKRKRFKVDSE